MNLFPNNERQPPWHIFLKTDHYIRVGTFIEIYGAYCKNCTPPEEWETWGPGDDFERSQWQSETQSGMCFTSIGEIRDRRFIDWYFAMMYDRFYNRLKLPEPESGILTGESIVYTGPRPLHDVFVLVVENNNFVCPKNQEVGLLLEVAIYDDAKRARALKRFNYFKDKLFQKFKWMF